MQAHRVRLIVSSETISDPALRQDSPPLSVNTVQYPDIPPEAIEYRANKCPLLEDEAKTSTEYCIRSQVGTSVPGPLPHLMRVYTASELSVVYGEGATLKKTQYLTLFQTNPLMGVKNQR